MTKHNPPNQSLYDKINYMLAGWDRTGNGHIVDQEAIHQLIQDEVIRELESVETVAFSHAKPIRDSFHDWLTDRISALREGKE